MLFFQVPSCLCVAIQLVGLPSVWDIYCGCLLWGGHCINREILSPLIYLAYTRRYTIVHLCIAELKAFHLTPSQHFHLLRSLEGLHLQTKSPVDIWSKWYLLWYFLHRLIVCGVTVSESHFSLSKPCLCDLAN